MAYKNIVQVGVRLIIFSQVITSDFLNRPQAPSAGRYSTRSLLLASSASPPSLVTPPSPDSHLRTTFVRSRSISLHTKHSSTPFAVTKPSFSLWVISSTRAKTPKSSPTQPSMLELNASFFRTSEGTSSALCIIWPGTDIWWLSDMYNEPGKGQAIFKAKHDAFAYVESKANEGKITWTSIANGPFFDWTLVNNFMGFGMLSLIINVPLN